METHQQGGAWPEGEWPEISRSGLTGRLTFPGLGAIPVGEDMLWVGRPSVDLEQDTSAVIACEKLCTSRRPSETHVRVVPPITLRAKMNCRQHILGRTDLIDPLDR